MNEILIAGLVAVAIGLVEVVKAAMKKFSNGQICIKPGTAILAEHLFNAFMCFANGRAMENRITGTQIAQMCVR